MESQATDVALLIDQETVGPFYESVIQNTMHMATQNLRSTIGVIMPLWKKTWFKQDIYSQFTKVQVLCK